MNGNSLSVLLGIKRCCCSSRHSPAVASLLLSFRLIVYLLQLPPLSHSWLFIIYRQGSPGAGAVCPNIPEWMFVIHVTNILLQALILLVSIKSQKAVASFILIWNLECKTFYSTISISIQKNPLEIHFLKDVTCSMWWQKFEVLYIDQHINLLKRDIKWRWSIHDMNNWVIWTSLYNGNLIEAWVHYEQFFPSH